MQANDFPGHNSSLFVLGVMILWFGWCASALLCVSARYAAMDLLWM